MSTAWGGESGVSTVFFSSSFFFRQRSPCFITKHFLLHFGGGGRCVACGLQLELEPAIRVPVFGSKFWGTFFLVGQGISWVREYILPRCLASVRCLESDAEFSRTVYRRGDHIKRVVNY
jgi:hypothetical protein